MSIVEKTHFIKEVWYLDSSALPDWHHWCRLRVLADGKAELLGGWGREIWPSEEEVCFELSQDEYSRLSDMIEDGEVPPTLQPPKANTDKELIAIMKAIADELQPKSQEQS